MKLYGDEVMILVVLLGIIFILGIAIGFGNLIEYEMYQQFNDLGL